MPGVASLGGVHPSVGSIGGARRVTRVNRDLKTKESNVERKEVTSEKEGQVKKREQTSEERLLRHLIFKYFVVPVTPMDVIAA